VILNVTGTVFRLYLIRVLGDVFDSPIQWILDFIKEYRVPLLLVTVGLVAFSVWNEHRLGKGEISSLTRLEDEMEEIEAEETEAEETEVEGPNE